MAARGDTIRSRRYNYTGAGGEVIPHPRIAKTYADGSVYEGDWKDDKKHGEGKCTFADGSVYEGELKNDKVHGEGKCTFASGEVYEGELKNGKRHGEGENTFASGTILIICRCTLGPNYYFVGSGHAKGLIV